MEQQEADQNRYRVILADPPWRYEKWKGDKGRRTAESFYPTMPIEELIAMRPMIDGWALSDCALFLWTTPPTIAEFGFKLLDGWGFRYRTFAFTWVKTNRRNGKPFFGMGSYTRSNAEPCLLATKGTPQVKARDVPQVILSPVREHSRKPDEQYQRIERLFNGPYIELFARKQRSGWDAWGEEIRGPASRLV
jgi:N6-adenosine-specific RNA methylase IME4